MNLCAHSSPQLCFLNGSIMVRQSTPALDGTNLVGLLAFPTARLDFRFFAPHSTHKSFPFFHFSWIQLRACFNATRRRHKIFINFPHGRMSLIRSCKPKHALFGNHHNWTHNLSEFNEPARARHRSHDSFSHRAAAAIRIESIILLSQRAVSRGIPGW